MPFAPEQTKEIKEQLLEQVEKLPQENKEQIKEYIQNLDDEQLEEFLKKNKIDVAQHPQNKKDQLLSECVFCSIVKGKTPSYKIAEDKKSIAILEINPLSKGHSIVIPIEHISVDKIPKSSLTLAQKIAKKIKKKLKSEDIKIETTTFQGHALINIIPIYKDFPLKKIKADEKDLKQIQKKLETKKRSPRKIKEKQEIKQEDIKLPKIHFRIP